MAKAKLSRGGFIRRNDSIGVVPVGGVVAWLKSFTGTPSLTSDFVECNGQRLNDPESPFNGENIPDLNGDASEPTVNYFLRGNAASGGTGGKSTHTLTITEMPAHTHTKSITSPFGFAAVTVNTKRPALGTITTSSTGGGGAHENKPPYYDVIWIMRIK